MLRKIKLYGKLAKFVGQKTFEAEVHSAAQAIKFLVVNFPQLEKLMADRYYKVAVDSWELEEKELHYPNGQEDIKIIPLVGGAGGRGVGRFIVGAVLIGAAIAFPGASLGYGGITAVKGYSAFQATVGNIGILLALSGTSGILFPQQELEDFENDQDPRISFSFNGVQNTSRAGTSVPIVYGEIITGSVVISAGIDTDQVHA